MTASEELRQLLQRDDLDESLRITFEKALATMEGMAAQITRNQATISKYGRKINQQNEATMAVLLGLNHILAIKDAEITDPAVIEAGEKAVTAAGGTVALIRQLIGQMQATAQLG